MRDLLKNSSVLILVMGRFGISLGFGDKSVREVCRMHNVKRKHIFGGSEFCFGQKLQL